MNNVGIAAGGNVVDVSEEDWRRVMDVNLTSMMLMCKHAIPKMIAGGGGAIVNLSSISALRGFGSSAYGAPRPASSASRKTWPWATAETASASIASRRATSTRRWSPRSRQEMLDLRQRLGPLGTEGTGWDVAWAVVFLASDEARWITGVTLPVDVGTLVATPLSMARHFQG